MNLEIFQFQETPIRVVLVEDQPHWVAADVCRALDLGNPSQALVRLDTDDVRQVDVVDAIGRSKPANVINEPGLYDLVLRSDKPEARVFKRWITREVLPAIRRNGRYEVENPPLPPERGWDLDSVFDLSRQAAEHLLAGTIQVNAAAAVAQLVQECRKTYELKFRVAPQNAVPCLPGGDSALQDVLVSVASNLSADTEFTMGELIRAGSEAGGAAIGEASSSGVKRIGRRLEAYRDRLMQDSHGRRFALHRRRRARGAVYLFRFEQEEKPNNAVSAEERQ